MAKKSALTQVRSVPLRPWVTDDAGGPVHPSVVEQRCRLLLDLTGEALRQTMRVWWTPQHFAALASGVSADDRALPASGFVAASRLGWAVHSGDFHRPSRFDRGVLNRAVALMRVRREEAPLMTALLLLVDKVGDFEIGQVRATPEGQWAPHVGVDRLARSIHRFRGRKGRDPQHLTELYGSPESHNPVFPFSACDVQFAALEVRERHLILKLKLPVVVRPEKARDWQWHRVVFKIPGFKKGVLDWSLPNLRLGSKGQVLFDFATSHDVPAWQPQEVAVGVDWSPGSLCCAATVRLEQGVLSTDGHGHTSGEVGRMSKVLRLQREEELTRAKRRRLEQLAEGVEERCLGEAGERPTADLDHKIAILLEQEQYLSRRRAFLNRETAWLAAHEVVDLAVREGAGLIGFEDLRDLDPQGRGVWQNNRSSQSVRGLLYSSTEHLARQHGIEVVQVPARGTSSRCVSCDGPVTHPGRHFDSHCPACVLSGDRDIWASVNIAKRALLGRDDISRPKTRARRVKKVHHQAVQIRARRKKKEGGGSPGESNALRHAARAPGQENTFGRTPREQEDQANFACTSVAAGQGGAAPRAACQQPCSGLRNHRLTR